jgi:mannose-6-phosphate isomerase
MAGLYPIKFIPILKERVWGGVELKNNYNKEYDGEKVIGESWELSGLQGDLSIASNGYLEGNNIEEIAEVYMGDLLGDEVYEIFGNEIPLLIKLIDVQDRLSVQVHPDDEKARDKHNAFGKTEMWYIMEAEKNAKVYAGFINPSSKEKFDTAIASGSIDSLINKTTPRPGDAFYIPAGRVHTIEGGIILAEIQQTSDVTYRIYDWDRKGMDGNPRELHKDLAEDVIDYNRSDDHFKRIKPIVNKSVELLACKYFTTNIIEINSIIERDYSKIDSFVIYLCTRGTLEIEWESETTILCRGETILIPATLENIKLKSQDASLLEIYIDIEKINES